MFDQFFTRSNCLAARLSAVGFVAVLLASSPVRADVYWSTSAGNWSNSVNWGGTVPTGSDNAWVVNGGTANISAMTPICDTLSLGSNAGNGTVQMTGGSLTTTGWQYVGNTGVGTFVQSGGSNSVSNNLCVGYSAGSSGVYTLGGNSSVYGGGIVVGWLGNGVMSQSSGTISTPNYFDLGYYAGGNGNYRRQ